MTFSTNRIDTRHFEHASENPIYIYPNGFYDGSNDDIYLGGGVVRFIDVAVDTGITSLEISIHDMFAAAPNYGAPVANGASLRRYTITAAGAVAETVDGTRSAKSTGASTAMVAANRVWQKSYVLIAGGEQVSETLRVACLQGMAIGLTANTDTTWSVNVGFEPAASGFTRYSNAENFSTRIGLS